ncbi:oligopeptide/dipeptide ABC transporter ATP-binding protein [Verminephrobacter eiseniae]|uniref:oligopeptide/dipeptide ABC transporter ATP-binding protein n=1 Tax=Verminephrobacter eiseniae TaxID=364317 RepID=UPI0022386E7A|nr:oligopeptide/dipeptide ABC transporter ATP-binding protein [Verminephrobacter eiseniae]MCW5238165.1 ATP-binding cassette domain-containing protein [Verminephrobacter eiseniae]
MNPDLSPLSPLLSVKDLTVRFPAGRDWLGRVEAHVHALNGVDLTLARGQTLCIVGESGCGKSTLAQVLAGLVRPTSGSVEVAGRTGTHQPLQIVFQDPGSSLDPRLRVWQIITEPVFLRRRVARAQLRAMAAQLAGQVGLRAEQMDRYPHEFSGGQRQRIAIARALSADPAIVVLDEPTSALDVSVQAQILNLLLDLQRERQLAYLFISHDMSVVRHIADDVAVMYLGQVVEIGAADDVLGRPVHPYTQLLLASVPVIGRLAPDGVTDNAQIPSNRRLPAGCHFRDRCSYAASGCEQPQLLMPLADGSRWLRCRRAQTIDADRAPAPIPPQA